MYDLAQIKEIINVFDTNTELLEKNAFVPGPPAQGPAAGGPPPPPPGDPNAMPPPPPQGDPNAAPPPPPGDPNAMPPQGDPAAAGGTPPAGGMPPELEQVLTDLGGGMQEMAQTVEQQQVTVEQLGKRQLELENMLQEMKSMLNGPAPFEGSTKTTQDISAEAGLTGAPSDSAM